ncbi:MAG: PRC-barrel domain-containing protein [Planctomycetes bacterium]|nr:PRC-barrel domain-containing protein [Planctomycetota bacterium]
MKTFSLLFASIAIVGLPLLAAASIEAKGPPVVRLASDLIGMKVVSQQGDDLGKIEDVVVRPAGEASYAVLSFGGMLGMGDKLFAMPWSVLRSLDANSSRKDDDTALVLPLDKERLKGAPGFDRQNWPAIANPEWTKEIDAFYAGDLTPDAKKAVDASARTSSITWKASELKGANVMNPAGEKLGDLKELAIDSNGRVSYVAVSVGGFLGTGDKLVAIPWDALKFSLGGDQSDKRVISLASTKQQLESAPEFKEGKDNRASMCDPKWITSLYAHFSCPVYWTGPMSKTNTRPPKN